MERGPSLVVSVARHAGTRDFLSCLGCSSQQSIKYLFPFPHRTLFQFMSPHRPATWAGSRAGAPVSECVLWFSLKADADANPNVLKPMTARNVAARKTSV
jgi:hypothetical protein